MDDADCSDFVNNLVDEGITSDVAYQLVMEQENWKGYQNMLEGPAAGHGNAGILIPHIMGLTAAFVMLTFLQ